MDDADLERRITSAYRRHRSAESEVVSVRRLTGGANAATYLVGSRVAGDDERSILRCATASEGFALNIDKSLEAAVQRVAFEHGVAVAEVLFVLDDDDGLGSGYAMAFVEGEVRPAIILRDAPLRAKLAERAGAVLAGIHRVPLAAVPSLPSDSVACQLRALRDAYDSYEQPSPVFEVAFRELEDDPPTPRPLALVHGDFRTGNLLTDAEGIRAVLDWELCHLGDPIEDLGWLCVASWRFARPSDRVGGFGSVEALRRSYVGAGGESFSDHDLRYWELYGTLRWGVICLYQVYAHLRGAIPSIERAAIGRRVSEVELALVELIEGV